MKTLKKVNFLSGKYVTGAELNKHRRNVELAGRLAAPKANVEINGFSVGDIPCEEVRPEYAHNPRYAILYVHGGGFVSGGLDYARILAVKMAVATGFTTFSFAYRLAPEHTYPAALTDAMAVWEDLIENNYTPDHILIAGDSAGGNLALCMVQKMINEKKQSPLGLILFSPWTDMTGNSETYESNKELDPILSKEYVMDAAKTYIADLGTPDDCRFSPLFGDFKDFPPALIMAGKNEILLGDSIGLRDRITQAGGRALLDIEENGWHVYQQMPIHIAERAMKRLAAYVSREVYGDGL
ncbi:MAG: alpha/beta hydrolase [Lachnospiraceae bacterium]|nr:alpha/beta hydrolase [Lachnospiraceae bacterium]